jgi:hypothetical protein
MSLLLLVPVVALLVLVLYAASRDERDNMQGHCKAAAIRALLEHRRR